MAAHIRIGSARDDSGATKSVRRAAERVFRKLRCEGISVEVCAIDKKQASALNLRYRRMKKPAEVLAFPLPMSEPGGLAGQICVCPAVVARRAAAIGRSRAGWLEELAVHAALHVLGFSHKDAAAAREMFSLQRGLLRCK